MTLMTPLRGSVFVVDEGRGPFGAKRHYVASILIYGATNVREMYLCWLCYLLIFHYDHILPDVVIE